MANHEDESETRRDTRSSIALIAGIGFGFALLAYSNKIKFLYSASLGIFEMELVRDAIELAAGIGVGFLIRANRFCFPRNRSLAMFLASMAAAFVVLCSLIVRENSDAVVLVVFQAVFSLSVFFMILMWMDNLFRLGPRSFLRVFAIGVIAEAVLNLAASSVQGELLVVAIALSLFASAFCYKMHLESFALSGGIDEDEAMESSVLQSFPERSFSKAAMFAIPVLFCVLAFNRLSFGWQSLFGFDLSVASGSIATLVSILMFSFFLARYGGILCVRGNTRYVVSLCCIGMLCAGMVMEEFGAKAILVSMFFTVIAHKLLVLFVFIAPLMYGKQEMRTGTLAFSLAYFNLCSLVAAWVMKVSPGVIDLSMDFILLIILLIEIVVFCMGNARKVEVLVESGGESTELEKDLMEACKMVAKRYCLTDRETEVLLHLAQMESASDIASGLCITVATAKTHMRKIYLKLGIHSQQELVNMIWKEKVMRVL